MSGQYGVWVEGLVREVAAGVGVPDFVFKPEEVDRGRARREVGDALLWIGHQLVVVSIKSRDPGVGADTPQRRDSWMGKHVKKAVNQINGTVRTLKSPPSGLVLRSERGVAVPWDPDLVHQISGVVVVDHPDPWEYVPDTTTATIPTVVFAAEDWHLLHTHFWSTASVVEYVTWRTRSGLPPLPLAGERDVIASAHLAEADLPRGTGFEVTPGAWERTRNDRPEIFFGTNPDDRYARVIDAMIAGAAEVDPLYTNVTSATDYLHIVEFLDRIPPLVRVRVGMAVLKKCESVGQSGGFDAMISLPGPGLLVVLADDSDRDERAKRIQSLAMARHTQLAEATDIAGLTTLGIATEPAPSPGRSHDFVLIRADFPLEDDERLRRDELFGTLPDVVPEAARAQFGGSHSGVTSGEV